MAKQKLQTELTASFGDGNSDDRSIGLVIENDYGSFTVDKIHLLLFPSVNATMRCTVGSVELGNRKPVDIPGGIVTFGGSNTASLPKRADSKPTEFTVLFAFDGEGEPVNDLGIQYDADTNVLTASRAVTAAVQYTAYRTLAMEVLYTPKVTPTQGGGSVSEYGVIAAFYPKNNLATYEVQPFGVNDGDSLFEAYRIVSNGVLNQDGRFEKPPGFPTTFTYPDKPLVIDPQGAVENQRIHEIGYMTASGAVYIHTPFVPILQPYTGEQYTPVKEFVKSTLPEQLFTKNQIQRMNNIIAKRGQGKL